MPWSLGSVYQQSRTSGDRFPQYARTTRRRRPDFGQNTQRWGPMYDLANQGLWSHGARSWGVTSTSICVHKALRLRHVLAKIYNTWGSMYNLANQGLCMFMEDIWRNHFITGGVHLPCQALVQPFACPLIPTGWFKAGGNDILLQPAWQRRPTMLCTIERRCQPETEMQQDA